MTSKPTGLFQTIPTAFTAPARPLTIDDVLDALEAARSNYRTPPKPYPFIERIYAQTEPQDPDMPGPYDFDFQTAMRAEMRMNFATAMGGPQTVFKMTGVAEGWTKPARGLTIDDLLAQLPKLVRARSWGPAPLERWNHPLVPGLHRGKKGIERELRRMRRERARGYVVQMRRPR